MLDEAWLYIYHKIFCSKNCTALHRTVLKYFFPAKHLAVVVVTALMEDVRLHEPLVRENSKSLFVYSITWFFQQSVCSQEGMLEGQLPSWPCVNRFISRCLFSICISIALKTLSGTWCDFWVDPAQGQEWYFDDLFGSLPSQDNTWFYDSL